MGKELMSQASLRKKLGWAIFPSNLLIFYIFFTKSTQPTLQENMISSSVFVYSLVPRNITKVYSPVLNPRKILGTDECRELYSSMNIHSGIFVG
jgi:hypothetical protein